MDMLAGTMAMVMRRVMGRVMGVSVLAHA